MKRDKNFKISVSCEINGKSIPYPVYYPDPHDNECVSAGDTFYHITYKGNTKTFLVPTGLRYDGASIPRPLWVTIGQPFNPDFIRAAFIHDKWYKELIKTVSRAYADEVFYHILLADGVTRFRAYKMYLAVSTFGRFCWDQK